MGVVTGVELLGGLAHVFVGARVLGVEGYGVLAIIVAATTLIHGFLSIPGGDTVTTYATRSIAEGRPREATSILHFTMVISLGLSVAAYCLIWVLALTATGLLRIDETHANALILYGLVGVLVATKSESIAVLRLADRVPVSLAVSLANNLTRVSVLIAVWIVGGGLVAVVLASVAGAAVGFAGLTAAAFRYAGKAGMPGFVRSPSLRVPKDVIGFHVGTYGRTLIGAVTQNVDTILVAQFVPTADVGLYRAARQIMDMTRRPFQLIRFGVQPELSRQWYSGQGAALRETLLRFSAYSLVLAVIGYAILALFRDSITTLVLGPEFVGVASLLLILIPGAFVASLAVLGGLPVAVGRVWPSMASSIAALVVSTTAIVLLVPSFAAEGASWARTSSSVVSVLVLVPFVVAIIRRSYNK